MKTVERVLQEAQGRTGIKYGYDPEHTLSYGYYFCYKHRCKFYPPDDGTNHKPGCPQDDAMLMVGPKFIEAHK